MADGRKICDIVLQEYQQQPITQFPQIPATIQQTLMDIQDQSVLIKVLLINKALNTNSIRIKWIIWIFSTFDLERHLYS